MTKADQLFKDIKQYETESRAIRAKIRAAKRSIVFELQTMPYADYLKTEHWKAIRRRALKKAGSSCQLCNKSDTTLNVHHRTYERRGKEKCVDVIVLCQPCHAKHHDKSPQ
jgi:5-methylcytosine-specific restriction endonuclease McrA